MLSSVLIMLGVATVATAAFLARRTASGSAVPDVDDPWSAFKPRTDADEETDRVRLWPAAVGLAGLVLVAVGAIVAGTSNKVETIPTAIASPDSADVAPQVLELDIVASPSPSPSAKVSASPSSRATSRPGSTGKPRSGSGSGGTSPTTRPSTPAPTPTPPPTPPQISATLGSGGNSNCFSGGGNTPKGDISWSWNVSPPAGASLTSVSVTLDGQTVGSTPSGSGSKLNAPKGTYTLTVSARSSNGGSNSTSRSYTVCG